MIGSRKTIFFSLAVMLAAAPQLVSDEHDQEPALKGRAGTTAGASTVKAAKAAIDAALHRVALAAEHNEQTEAEPAAAQLEPAEAEVAVQQDEPDDAAVADEPDKPDATQEKLITIQTARTDITDALRLVAEQGGLNLIIGPGVDGEVSLHLEQVPVETALRAIAVPNGFAYSVEGGIITVSRKPERREGRDEVVAPLLLTRIFRLQWQDAEKVRDALEFALSPYGRMKVLNENSEGRYVGANLNSLSGDIEDSASIPRAASPSAGSAAASSSAGAEQAPKNSRTLVVTDTPESLKNIADLVADLDRVPPQVLIEARIVEMTTDLERQLGIDWDMNVLANGPVLNHEMPLNWRGGFAPGNQIRHSPDGTVQTSASLALGTIDFTNFTAMLRIHQSDSSMRLLANPRLLVFNNHNASILVGERYPIFEANITDQGTLTEAFDTYIPVGIQLEVTPTIMTDGRISIFIHPVTSALGDDVIGTTGLRVRRILTRELSTRALMHDGQTIVLGGLISDRKARTINKLPGLGDIPVLDVFFRQENPQSNRVDLLVFITAHVERALEISKRDQKVFNRYKPHFKHEERLQDVPLHFEIPTEYEQPKPMFGDPFDAEFLDLDDEVGKNKARDNEAGEDGIAKDEAGKDGIRDDEAGDDEIAKDDAQTAEHKTADASDNEERFGEKVTAKAVAGKDNHGLKEEVSAMRLEPRENTRSARTEQWLSLRGFETCP